MKKKFPAYLFFILFGISLLLEGCSSKSKVLVVPDEEIDVDYCIKEADVDEHKKLLSPFKYEGFQYLEVNLKPYDQIVKSNIEIKYEADHTYVFSKRGLPQVLANARVKIFDDDFSNPNQKLLFESTEKVFSYTYKSELGLKRLYFEYQIPAKAEKKVNYVDKKGVTHDNIKLTAIERGCIGFVYGYDNTPK